jgi:integrase/recombinase XerD
MSNYSIFTTPPQTLPEYQESPSPWGSPKQPRCQIIRIKIPLKKASRPQKTDKNAFEHTFERLSAMDFPGKDYVEEYLRHQYRRNFRPNTLRGNLTACQLFLEQVKKLGKANLEQISRQDLEAFVEHEQDRGISIVSVKRRLSCVYAFLRFLHDKGVVHAELLVRKIRLRLPDPLPRAMDPNDVRKLLSVIDHVRDRAFILVLLRTGMRIGELLNTQVGDVNLAERKIDIYEAQKNRVGRVVCISDDAVCALRAWFKIRDPDKANLFYGYGRDSFTYQGARAMFGRCLKKAELEGKGYSPHCLRHTFATELLNAGMRLECLQPLLGHSNIEVTRRYARLTDKTREEEYFAAMKIIEKGEIDDDYQLDS